MTPEEAAWSAGLFDGEGCVQPNGGYPSIVLQMTDKDVVERFAALIGGNVREQKATVTGKRMWRTNKSGYAVMSELYRLWEPWLSARRKARWTEVMELSLEHVRLLTTRT